MPTRLRRVILQGTWGGSQAITQMLSAEATFDISNARFSTCTFVTPRIPPGLGYYQDVSIVMGIVNGNQAVRFNGLTKDFTFSLKPRRVETYCEGYLSIASEYENTRDPSIIGGLIPSDLTTGGLTIVIPGLPNGYVDTAGNIIAAVLDECGLNGRYSRNNIGSGSLLYGLFEESYVWKNGTNSENFDLQEEGESGISYIERYDEIDGDDTGRYRTYENLPDLGGIGRGLMSYPPSGQPDIPPFTETVDILEGQIKRSIRNTRNYFVVTGYDTGSGAGPEFAVLATSNDFQLPGTKHTKHGGSPMVERSLHTDPGYAQACDTLCNALAAEFNREIITGYIVTYRDDLTGLLHKHQISGNGGQPDRLGTGQLVLVTGCTISVNERGFRQRFNYIG